MSTNEMEVDDDIVKEDEDEEEDDEEESSDEEGGEEKTFLPGGELGEGEELGYDSGAYIVYHQASLGPPCLSFDVIPEV